MQPHVEVDEGSMRNSRSKTVNCSSPSCEMLSVDEMINDDTEFEMNACEIDDREWEEEPLASETREIVNLISPDTNNSPSIANVRQNDSLQIANSSQAGDQNDVVDLTRSGENMMECDDLRRRRGVKRRVHTVCEWSSSSREKMIKHLHIDLT